MRLLGVEVRRFFARSAIQWLIAGALILAASGALLGFGSAVPMSESERAESVAYFQEAHADWVENAQSNYEMCLVDEALDQEVYPDADWGCEYALEEPKLENWIWEPTFVVDGIGLVLGLVNALQFIVLFAAVTFVAAEFTTGALSNWLTFEPRRMRVLMSKLGAAVLGVTPVLAIAFGLALVATYIPFARVNLTGPMTAQTWVEYVQLGGRAVFAGALIAIIGVGLAFLVRHVAAVIGIVAGWLLIVEQLGSLAYPQLQHWILANNYRALVEDGTVYGIEECSLDSEGMRSCVWTEVPITGLQGGLVLGTFALVITVVAVLVFRRRDVN